MIIRNLLIANYRFYVIFIQSFAISVDHFLHITKCAKRFSYMPG